MSLLFRRSFKTAILSRFLKVAIATPNFMNEVIKKERKKQIVKMIKANVNNNNNDKNNNSNKITINKSL